MPVENWPEFTTASQTFLQLNDDVKVVDNVRRKLCLFWRDQLPPLLAAMNVSTTPETGSLQAAVDEGTCPNTGSSCDSTVQQGTRAEEPAASQQTPWLGLHERFVLLLFLSLSCLSLLSMLFSQRNWCVNSRSKWAVEVAYPLQQAVNNWTSQKNPSPVKINVHNIIL